MSMYRLTQAGHELNYGYQRSVRIALAALGPVFAKDEVLEKLRTLQGLRLLGKVTSPKLLAPVRCARGSCQKESFYRDLIPTAANVLPIGVLECVLIVRIWLRTSAPKPLPRLNSTMLAGRQLSAVI